MYFLVYRLEHTLHSVFDILDSLIDDAICTDIDLLLSCKRPCAAVGTDIEANNDSVRCGSKRYIRFRDSANAAVNNLYTHFFIGELFKCLPDRLNAAVNIGLYDDI